MSTIAAFLAIIYMACVFTAVPNRRWTLPLQKSGLVLAWAVFALDLVAARWRLVALWAFNIVVTTATLELKRRNVRRREALMRRWDS